MGGNGKHRWKISFYHRSSTSPRRQQQEQQPPEEFHCPISGSLMSDPVVVQSGQTFERVSVQVCLDLGFTPALSDGSVPDFSTLIPNLAIKSAILSWCRTNSAENPQPLDYESVESIVREKMDDQSRKSGPDIRVSERELLKAVAENPPVIFSHAVTEVGHRVNHFNSSSSDESVFVTASPHTPLPLTRRPACFSSGSSSSSGDIADNEALMQKPNSQFSSPEEQELFLKLRNNDIYDQEQAVISLRKITRTTEEARVSLCTPRILAALRPLIVSRYSVAQTNAIASLVNLSLEKPNKVVIVRSGFVPLLIDALKAGSSEAQEHAAGALFSLALEDENKMAIGVLGALQPLLRALRSDSERTRHDSALALYHFSLTQSNRVKLVKFGAISTLLSLVKSGGDMASCVLLVLCNLAANNEGKSAMLDANAVEIFVGMLREGELHSEATRENCVAAIFALSHGSLRFKGLAKEARAAEVLRGVEERGSDRARDKARRILQMMKGREEEDIDWEAALASGGLSRPPYRAGKDVFGANSTNF